MTALDRLIAKNRPVKWSNGQNENLAWLGRSRFACLVYFEMRQTKCVRSFKTRQDERDYTVRRTNEDWPPVPATQIPLRCKIFMASGPGANARNKFKSSLITLIWHYPFAWLFFTNLNALFQCSGVTLCSNLLITSTPGANLELCYIPI